MKPPALIIEEAALVAQSFDGPVRDLVREDHRAGNATAQLYQRNNCRCRRVHVGGIETIGIILGPTVVLGKSVPSKIRNREQARVRVHLERTHKRR